MDVQNLKALAEMICGGGKDDPVRRTGPQLTEFFQRAGLNNCCHDGSTRARWTFEVLERLSAAEIDRIILRLADPKEYAGESAKVYQAIHKLNQILRTEGLVIELIGTQPILKEIPPPLKGEAVTNDLTSDVDKSPRTETRNILFMDLSNWSKLPAHKVVDYLNKALPGLAEIVQKKHAATHLNTWGDALVVTFGSTLDAANCALDIRDYFRRTPESGGVPEGLVPRLSLHVGEVIIAYNPLLKSRDIFGEAVHLAARLEPVTPRGEVYCTESFADGLRSIKGLGPSAHAIGTIELPKNFGTVKAFAVTGPGESAPLSLNENGPTTEPLDTNPSQVFSLTIDPLLSDWEKEGDWIPDISRVPVDLQVTNSDRGGILVATKSWTDYEFEFETKIDRDYTAWIIRAHDLDNYVMLQCGHGRITPLYRRDGLWWSEKESKLAQPLPKGWFKVRIQVKGDTVSVFQLDAGERTVLFKGNILAPRTLSLEACRSEPDIPNYSSRPVFVSYLRGGVGFRACGHESAYFRNITVRPIVETE